MKEVRIHARAGQGAITTASIMGHAAFASGKYAYAFPHFGAARMGAPMNAFLRVDVKPIRMRSQVYEPDYLLVIDPTIMRAFDVYSGIKDGGLVVVNQRGSCHVPLEVQNKGVNHVCVPGNEIADEVMGRPLGNTTCLGAFAAVSDLYTVEALNEAVRERFGAKGKIADLNVECVKRGYDYVKEHYGSLAEAR
jgi:pyruvate ferredoxin oxidoreductase gamma subunit